MIYPLVLEIAGDGIPVSVTCQVLGLSKQVFYNNDPTFGYRFIADELTQQGHSARKIAFIADADNANSAS